MFTVLLKTNVEKQKNEQEKLKIPHLKDMVEAKIRN